MKAAVVSALLGEEKGHILAEYVLVLAVLWGVALPLVFKLYSALRQSLTGIAGGLSLPYLW